MMRAVTTCEPNEGKRVGDPMPVFFTLPRVILSVGQTTLGPQQADWDSLIICSLITSAPRTFLLAEVDWMLCNVAKHQHLVNEMLKKLKC